MGKKKPSRTGRLTNRLKRGADRLFFQEVCLGEITEIYGESHWMSGTLTPTPAAATFQNFFRWMVDEENAGSDPPFGEDLLDESNWFIEQADGQKVGITVPAVHQDGEIGWRWR